MATCLLPGISPTLNSMCFFLSTLSQMTIPAGFARQGMTPNPNMAEAWGRLSDGSARNSDIVLLQHEYAEMKYYDTHPGAS